MSRQLNCQIDEHLYNTLTDHARREHKTLSSVVKESLAEYIAARQTVPASDGRFTFIDLFAGIGGMRIAFTRQGGVCLFSSEWDKYAQKTYFDNFGVLPQGDITQIAATAIPDHDILVAGFPCQPFSIAGVSKKNSLGRATGFQDKTQGTLFFDVCRILDGKRPKAFLLENVKNLMSHDKGNTWRVIRESLEQLDYAIFPQVIDGKGFVPQHRERIFIVGFDRRRYGDDIDFAFDVEDAKPQPAPCLRDILEPVVDAKYTLSDKMWTYLQGYAAKHKALGHGFGYGLPELDGVARTLSARYYKDGSPRECARLQGYPDSFRITVSDTRAYKQFGNSVVVPLITAIAGKIADKVEWLDSRKIKEAV